MKRIKLTKEQLAAVAEIDEYLQAPYDPAFKLFGAAGVGKTTTAREVMERHPGGLQCAFSGKAAYNLRVKTGHPAQTLHSAIYRPGECPGGRERGGEPCEHGSHKPHVVFFRNWNGALSHAKYLILDECSMVNGRIGRDAESFGKPILVLGDPYQLPPPEGCGYFTNHEPDVLLTEVHRHKDDGGIIDLATKIRLGESIEGHPFITDDPSDFAPDIVVCGTNNLRVTVNKYLREADDLSGFPHKGEPLICLQNTPDLGLLNGQILTVIEAEPTSGGMYVVTLDDPWSETRYTVPARVSDLDRRGLVGMDDYTPNIARLSFAYAITCHKAAGSEWEKVLVMDNWGPSDHSRWLYTAVTRASREIQILPC